MPQLSIPDAFHESEINFSLSTFWDEDVAWKLGDEVNGFVEEGHARTVADALARSRARLCGISQTANSHGDLATPAPPAFERSVISDDCRKILRRPIGRRFQYP
jgi:hypothetical protein